MAEVIGVRLQRSGTVVYVDPQGQEGFRDDGVIIQTDRGVEYGTVVIENSEWDEGLLPSPQPKLVRLADDEDVQTLEQNQRMAADAAVLCGVKISEHHLAMKLVDAEYTFDRDKLVFYFTAEDRVDFRSLVRDLAQTFRTRIELRQIGVRDQAKMIGGLGACGQPICCRRYMKDFAPVSIKMAKTQGLSLNPTKISGVCGRLMCCLNYEQEHYLQNTKQVPPKGTLVLTEDGQGYVVDRDVLLTRVRVHVYKADGSEDEKYYTVSELEVLQRRKKGQTRPTLRTQEELASHHFVTEGEKAAAREAREAQAAAQAAAEAAAAKAAEEAERAAQEEAARVSAEAAAAKATEEAVRASQEVAEAAAAETAERAAQEEAAQSSATDASATQTSGCCGGNCPKQKDQAVLVASSEEEDAAGAENTAVVADAAEAAKSGAVSDAGREADSDSSADSSVTTAAASSPVGEKATEGVYALKGRVVGARPRRGRKPRKRR